jgi:hypothetical protein
MWWKQNCQVRKLILSNLYQLTARIANHLKLKSR